MSSSQISELLKLNELSVEVQEATLRENFRGRDNLRELFQLKTDSERLKVIEQVTVEKVNKTPKKSFSVLRLSYDQEDLKIQRQALEKLSTLQRNQVREVLEQIVRDLY